MTTTVTLRFDGEYLDLECEHVQVATDDDQVAATPEGAFDVPAGYVRIVAAQGYHPGPIDHQIPSVDEGNTALVSDEHVAMIQWGD